MSDLDDEIFTCMDCGKQFSHKDGTWPQNNSEGEPIYESDFNDRTPEEFVCYDCLD